MQRGNIFSNLPDARSGEVIQILSRMQGKNVRVERIVTEGQATPEGEWYDQAWHEWVLVLKGGAEIELVDPAGEELLEEGDWLLIPPHRKHRVRSARMGTVWLAIHADTEVTHTV